MRELKFTRPVRLHPPRRRRGVVPGVPGDTLTITAKLDVRHDLPGAGPVTIVGIRWEPIYSGPVHADALTLDEQLGNPE